MIISIFRKRLLYILFFSILWETAARAGIFPPLLFPSLSDIGKVLLQGIRSGELLYNTGFSLYLIFFGLLTGLFLALISSTLAIVSKPFYDFIETAMTVMHPLPGIALLPLAILWFGTGQQPIILVIVHATVWPMILNNLIGFKAVPPIYREVGENIGLTGPRLVLSIMIPAAFPYLLAGLKIGWARAWRALIAAEMIFGSAGIGGGLGWYIYKQRYLMNISGVFAALILMMIIGITVEDLVFGLIERKTVKKWGMST